jgi:hypothetical protein
MTTAAQPVTTAAAQQAKPLDLAGLIADLRKAAGDTPSQAGQALLEMATALAALAALPGPPSSKPADEPLLKVEEVAARLRINVPRVYELVRLGRLTIPARDGTSLDYRSRAGGR